MSLTPSSEIKYAAYAVSLGYTLSFPLNYKPEVDAPDGFMLRDVMVARTGAGWRVFKSHTNSTEWVPSKDADFTTQLPRALRMGVERARAETEADRNPLIPAMRQLLRLFQDGVAREVGNPYCNDAVIGALHDLKIATKYPGSWMDCNQKPVEVAQ